MEKADNAQKNRNEPPDELQAVNALLCPNSQLKSLHKSRQYFFQKFFLSRRQGRWESDIYPDNEVASLVWFLGINHTQPWVAFLIARLSRSWLANSNGFSVNCPDNTLPPSEGFLKIELDGPDKIITAALEGGVLFL